MWTDMLAPFAEHIFESNEEQVGETRTGRTASSLVWVAIPTKAHEVPLNKGASETRTANRRETLSYLAILL